MLVLEDDLQLQHNLLSVLRKEFSDYEVDGADGVSEAKRIVQAARRRGLVTRVIIADEVLKDGRGSEFLAFVHSKYPAVRTIMLAAQATPEDLSRAINLGSLARYILKDEYSADLLVQAIRGALQDETTFIFDAISEALSDLEHDKSSQKPILIAGHKRITPGNLLQHINMQTELGRTHMKEFARLIYDAFLDPTRLLDALEARRRATDKSKYTRNKGTTARKKSKD